MKRVIAVVFAGLWGLAMLWVSGGQMRESDQASLLAGAVEIARDGVPLAGNGSYNYDKQFLSYWVLAAALKITGAVGEEASLERVVMIGNRTAVLVFVLALLVAVGMKREWEWGGLLVLVGVLLSPVVAFTVPLLSPNVVCGSFVLLLLGCLGRRGTGEATGVGGGALLFVLAFAATAARQDVILLMPLVALLAIGDQPLGALLRNGAVWAMAAGCVVAIGTGIVLAESRTPLPEPFFVAPIFAVYVAGGLGASVLLLLVFAGGQAGTRTAKGVFLGGALLLPFLFYGLLLYTPRHLFLVSLGLIATVLLPLGSGFWRDLAGRRLGQAALGLVLVGTLVPWLLGVRLTDRTAGRLVAGDSTLYPSADGFWPLGAYGEFLTRLAGAADEPLDHNQEVWAAWTVVNPDDLPEGRPTLLSSGLASFGRLFLVWNGLEEAESRGEADYVLFDDRTLSKRQVAVDQKDHRGKERALDLLTEGQVKVLGRSGGRAILCWTGQSGDGAVDEAISLRLALVEAYKGNDFRLGRGSGSDWKAQDWRGHRMFLAARSVELLEGQQRRINQSLAFMTIETAYDDRPWEVVWISGDELRLLLDRGGVRTRDVWIACGVLPEFMDIGGYGE